MRPRLSATLAQAVGRDKAALVASLEDGGPAATAGITVGDLLVELDGVAITGPESLRAVLGDRPGQTATLVLYRAGTRHELSVAIGSRA